MKKLLFLLLLGLILTYTIKNKEKITRYIMIKYIDNDIKLEEKNEYYRDYDYAFVQNTTNLYPTNKQEVTNLIYTILNIGQEEAIFYCNYKECIDDVNQIAEDREYLSNINNMVHPYNSYKNISFTINKYGRIKIKIKKIYSESEALLINNKIEAIEKELNIENLNDYEKIKAFHDYIINNTKYDDQVTLENQNTNQNSNKATGLLFENKAICSGYSDTIAIFLNKHNFNNYRISSEEHIWNLVNIENTWKHIDATWDDPVATDGRNILLHDFFMIDTQTLIEREGKIDTIRHNYDKNVYIEAN